MKKCGNKFSADSWGVDMRSAENEHIKMVCCKDCVRRLKKAIEKFEKLAQKTKGEE